MEAVPKTSTLLLLASEAASAVTLVAVAVVAEPATKVIDGSIAMRIAGVMVAGSSDRFRPFRQRLGETGLKSKGALPDTCITAIFEETRVPDSDPTSSRRISRKLRCKRGLTLRARAQQGFSLVEVLVAGIVLVVGLVFIAQFFTSTAMRVLASDTRSLMAQMANQEIETIRGLQYQDIGTVGGQPSGQLQPVETMTVEGRQFEVRRDITYYEDPSYTGPYPANYRRVTITVAPIGDTSFAPVVMSTNVAGGAKGGTLDITVTDLAGDGLPNVRLAITDNLLAPNVSINAPSIHTDSSGHLQIPGLTPDPNGGYFVGATLAGYNHAALQSGVVVANGTSTVVQLIMDRLATMNIHLTDQLGNPLPGVALKVTGYMSVDPWDFSQNVTTDANGHATLEDIRYSTSLEPYFIELVTPHNPPLDLPTGVADPTIDSSFLPLPAGKIPVILNPGQTQTVDLVVSTGPAVTSISPTSGSLFGGTTVVINGANFTGATAVTFGDTAASSFVVNSSSKITAVSPAGWGTVDVTVTAPSGTSAAVTADQYTYYVYPPTVSSISPSSGWKGGGTTVIITGTNFVNVTTVKFGTKSAASFTVLSTTSIRAVTPSVTSAGWVDVTVANSAGTSPIWSGDRFTYNNKQ